MFGLVKLSGLALLGLSVVTFGSAFQGAPAVDQSARIENVAGEWRVSTGNAMYNRAEHLFQIGQSYLSSGLVVDENGQFGAESFDLEEELAQKARAIDLLKESLRLRPGNAYTWTALAWAYATESDPDSYFEAIGNSWKFAPNNAQLGFDRLVSLEMVASFEDDLLMAAVLELFEDEIVNDIKVVQRFKPRELEEVMLLALIIPELMAKHGLDSLPES